MSVILHRAEYGGGRRLRTKSLSHRAVADSDAALGVGMTTVRELGRVSCRAASHNPIRAVELYKSQSETFNKYCHSEAERGGGISLLSFRSRTRRRNLVRIPGRLPKQAAHLTQILHIDEQ